MLLVEKTAAGEAIVPHGLPDEAFERTEVPVAQSEIRSISLFKLYLTQGSIAYDVGSGSGPVSVEAALQAIKGKEYAVEMKENAVELTKLNGNRFGLENVEAICGKAPLPAPTHALIGGSSGSMKKIIDCLPEKNPQVRIVVNAATMETWRSFPETLIIAILRRSAWQKPGRWGDNG